MPTLSFSLAALPESEVVKRVRERAWRSTADLPEGNFTLAELGLAFRQDVGRFLTNDIEFRPTRECVGCVISNNYRMDEVLNSYTIVLISNGLSFEFVELGDTKGTFQIYANAQALGDLRSVRHHTGLFGLTYPDQWEIRDRGSVFGTVTRGRVVRRDSLSIHTTQGQYLPLRLACGESLLDAFRSMGTVLTLGLVPPSPSVDWIVAPGTEWLSDEEMQLYFAAALLLRCLIMQLDRT